MLPIWMNTMDDDDDIEIIEDVTVIEERRASRDENEFVEMRKTQNFRSERLTISEDSEDEIPKKKVKKAPASLEKQLAKEQKAEAAAEKRKQREEAKLLKENEAKKRKIEREVASSNKTKSEQYTFCHVGREFLKIQGLELCAKMLFSERNLDSQLIFDDSLDIRVEFRRKQVEVLETAGTVEKLEYTCLQHTFAILIEAAAFCDLVQADSLDEFVIGQQTAYPIPNSQLIIICYGEHKLPSHKIMDLNISLFEESRTHVEYLNSPTDLSLFLAQTLRALAKKAASSGEHKLLVDIEKGIDSGSRDEIVKDWWDKMLTAVVRIGSSQRRAITKHIPDPIRAVQDFRQRGYDTVTKELSDLLCDNGRRLGPAMAHRLYVMLTDTTGNPIID